MVSVEKSNKLGEGGIAAPLRHTAFRRIWVASLLSNLGILIQGVGAAWAMTQLTSSADMVALVQTAVNLPVMLIAIPAGAIADMHDRRIVALISVGVALAGAIGLTMFSWMDLTTSWSLLTFCFVVSCGMALMAPAWQSSVSEQVPAEALPSAIALNGISYNIARSVGPAIGGIVVATAGAVAAFALNAVLYLPLIVTLLLWERISQPSHLPPERLARAIASGMRYVMHSPSMKVVIVRATVTGLVSGAILALMPLVSKDFLHGSATTYGIMLSAFGIGAVLGAFNLNRLCKRFSTEDAIRLCALGMSVSCAVVAFSRVEILTAAGLVLAGATWMTTWTLFNISVQMTSPRWVAGRALAAYQAAGWGGVAVGSWAWGHLADIVGIEFALLLSAALTAASLLVGIWLRMPPIVSWGAEGERLNDPQIRLPLTASSGPLIVEIEYRVLLKDAPAFDEVMREVQLFRQRNGAYGWSLACDIADPESWTERYHCPTWLDYIRQRNRSTQSERALDQRASAYHIGPGAVKVRRMVERPLNHVKWTEYI